MKITGGDEESYHSLPHPQEHASNYNKAQSRRNMMMGGGYQSESSRLFGSVMDGVSSGGGQSSYDSGGARPSRRGLGAKVKSSYVMQSARSGLGMSTFGGQQSIAEGDEYYYDEEGEMYYDDDYYGGGGGSSQYQSQQGGGGGVGGPKYRNPLDDSGRSGMSGMSNGSNSRMSMGDSRMSMGGGGGNQSAYYGQSYYGQSEANLSAVNEDEYYYEDEQQYQQQQPIDRRAQMAMMKAPSGSSFRSNQESFRSFQPSTGPGGPSSSRMLGGGGSARFGAYNQSSKSSRSFQVEEMEESLPVSPLRQLLDAVNMSILPTSLRLSSLAQAVEFFDHRDRSMHDSELKEGAAFVLYHKLGLVLRLSKSGEAALNNDGAIDNSSSGVGGGSESASSKKMNHYLNYQQSLANSLMVQQQSEFDKEIAMICSCLEMVHRANPDAIAQTWDECGIEILPLLVTVLERPFQKIERAVWLAINEKANVPGSLERAVATAVTRDQKLAAQKVTKVLAMYSLVPEAKKPMCDCPGMLRWLTRIVDTHNFNRVKPGAPPIGGMSSKGSINGGGSDGLDAKQAKRQEMATRATSGAGLYMTEAARFNTIATLTNLAAHEANRMNMLHEPGLLDNICRAVHNERSDVPKQCAALAIMNMSNGDMDNVPEMARNDLVLDTLLKLMKEDNPETRRNAVVTLFNVACSDQNTVRLARYRDGTILEALVDLVGSDDTLGGHDEARANAAETLFNMSCSEISETTDRMANHAGLLECLAVTLKSEHTGLEVKMYCSATLRRMAEIIRAPMIAQGALLSALVKAATWTSTDCIAEAFRAQAEVPENCVIMARHHGLLNALSKMALTKGEGQDVENVRTASCLAIELMSRQDEARALLSQNEGIIMALTKASYGDEEMSAVMSHRGANNEGYMDDGYGSRRSSEGLSQDDYDEDGSMQSRRIQVALKNLVQAM